MWISLVFAKLILVSYLHQGGYVLSSVLFIYLFVCKIMQNVTGGIFGLGPHSFHIVTRSIILFDLDLLHNDFSVREITQVHGPQMSFSSISTEHLQKHTLQSCRNTLTKKNLPHRLTKFASQTLFMYSKSDFTDNVS